MRKSAKALVLVVVSLLVSIGLTFAAAFSAALAFGAVALIVPGTGTHNIATVMGYKENARDRYIPACAGTCTGATGLQGIDYPATFFPLVIFPGWCPGLSCDTWNTSVGTGVSNLDDALTTQLGKPVTPDNEDIVIFGYSQGGAVVSQEMYKIPDADKSRVSVVTIGNINNPLGLWSRLSFLPTIPFLDVSFGPQLPTNIGIKSTNYAFEYDPVGDAPQYWGNPLAMLNAVAALEYVHGNYLVPNSNDPLPDGKLPYGYDDASLALAINDPKNRNTYQDATFVLIPQKGTLPLFQPFVDLAKATGTSALVNPLVALVSPLTKLLINLGYDRTTNPGIARTLSILPFNPFAINPITFPIQVVGAIVQGVQDALGGGTTAVPAAVPPAATPTTNTTFARAASTNSLAVPTVNAKLTKDSTQSLVSQAHGSEQGQSVGDQQDPAVTTDLTTDLEKAAADAKAAAEKAAADAQAAAQKAADDAKVAADKAAADAKVADDKKQDDKKQDDKKQDDKKQDQKKQDDKKQDQKKQDEKSDPPASSKTGKVGASDPAVKAGGTGVSKPADSGNDASKAAA